MVNKGLGNVMNLSWDQYEGFGYLTFYIWRKHASTGWVQLTALPANLFSYTDLTPPVVGTLLYMIEVAPTSGYVCNSTAKDINTNINTTRSNTKDNFVTQLLTGVKENEGVIFDLFPNPVNELLNIYTNNKVINSVKILDVTGRLLQQEKLENKATHTQINTANFVSGIYLIEIQTKDGVMRKPFVKE